MKIESQQKITPFLWFDGNVEEAVNFYTSVFKNSKVLNVHQLPGDVPGAKGKVMTATFELEGMKFMALDGGPQFKFTPAISLFVDCKDQEEVDDLWNKLSEGGRPDRCGWLQDKYGLSWQIIPKALGELMGGPDRVKANRVMQAMLKMSKLIVADLQKAYDGK